MGLKESGLRGSLRNVSVGIDAIPDSVVDNFEDFPDGPYESGDSLSDFYSGDLGVFSRTTSDVPGDGDYALDEDGSGNVAIISEEGDGLPRYPEKGEIFSVLMRNNGSNSVPYFGWATTGTENSSDGYGIKTVNDEIRFIKNDGDEPGDGERLVEDSTGDNMVDEWIHVEVEWHDGTGSESDGTMVYNVHFYDTENNEKGSHITSGSVTDTDYDDKGIAFALRSQEDAGTAFDDYKVIGNV